MSYTKMLNGQLSKIELDGKSFLYKTVEDRQMPFAAKYKGKYRTTINGAKDFDTTDTLHQSDVKALGYSLSSDGFLSMLGYPEYIISPEIFLNKNVFFQDLGVFEEFLKYLSAKETGLVAFDEDGKIEAFLKKNSVNFERYDENNLFINLFTDINEHVLIDVYDFSDKERALIYNIMNFSTNSTRNKKSDIDIDVFEGKNWIYDFLYLYPNFDLSAKYHVNEGNVAALKNTLMGLRTRHCIDEEKSSIADIRANVRNGKITLIREKDKIVKKLIKKCLETNYKADNFLFVDNEYSFATNSHYYAFGCELSGKEIPNFDAFVINRHFSRNRNYVPDMFLYEDEIRYLDFEYLLCVKDSFPIIVECKECTAKKAANCTITKKSTKGFY